MDPIRALQTARKTHVMQIINKTPDSFSTKTSSTPDSASAGLLNILKYGTPMIFDIGGQSSAPGTIAVSAETETKRILPLIKSLKRARNTTYGPWRKAPGFAISVDTYRASVAKAAVEKGADIINDISAGKLDKDMLRVMAESGKTVVLMHMRGDPVTMSYLTDYPNGLIPTIAKDLLARVEEAEAAGVRRWRIILDPGIGFAKTTEQNVEILRSMAELRDWPGLRGLPWLVGSSRKKFIGEITGEELLVKSKRSGGTAATVAAAIQGGADIVRVHEADHMAKVVRMCDAIWRV